MPQLFGRTKNVSKRSKKYLEEALYFRLFKEGSSELSEAMSKRGMNKTVSDQAIHLDLVAKTRGITAAENYFIDLPETLKNHLTYGALLNCYCKELMTEEAEALMEKMKELNLGLTSMSYNSLMTLYTKVGQPERIPAVIQEMKTKNIMPDSYTYNVWMRALAAVNDTSGAERVVEEMKRDGRVAADWTTYSNLASIYIDAGLHEKAEKALKELEKRNAHQDHYAFQFLITCMVEQGICLRGIARKGRRTEGEGAQERAKPNAKTWEIFLGYYLDNEDIKLAVDCLANAISIGRGNGQKYVPSPEIVGSFMAHFEQQKDVDRAEGFIEILKKAVDNLGANVFESLIRTYAAAGRTSSVMLRRLKMENVEVSEASQKLLEVISVE
ncbi:hypothetical protein GH714_023832 [Hevea brasiliensis]|uniref:Pentacotripeptide-repeat region of PRORP domain-containing protein n=1 Tax=Hevea brasiliensis TaxID=3981 RepID=A0A6A6KD59_HEVBR|nr:hypothetical protein GH714_023832 [Hevea brasiliensis]